MVCFAYWKRRAAEAPEATENRSKLHAAAEAVAGAGREVMVDVAAKDQ